MIDPIFGFLNKLSKGIWHSASLSSEGSGLSIRQGLTLLPGLNILAVNYPVQHSEAS